MEKILPYVFLDHMADVKIKVSGATLSEIFENSVLAFAEYVTGDTKLQASKGKIIEVSGTDTPSLLYNFLDELIYLLDAEHFVTKKAEVLIRGNNLKAEIFGDDTHKYNLQAVKAATYAEMSISKTKKGWEAIFVLDV